MPYRTERTSCAWLHASDIRGLGLLPEFVVKTLALGQGFLRAVWFPSVSVFPPVPQRVSPDGQWSHQKQQRVTDWLSPLQDAFCMQCCLSALWP